MIRVNRLVLVLLSCFGFSAPLSAAELSCGKYEISVDTEDGFIRLYGYNSDGSRGLRNSAKIVKTSPEVYVGESLLGGSIMVNRSSLRVTFSEDGASDSYLFCELKSKPKI